MESARALLTAFSCGIEKQPDNNLRPEVANRLATALGYSENDLFTLAESLRKEGLLDIQWGGNIRLTEKAIDFLQPQNTPNTVHLGPGAIYAPNAEKVLGHGAADHSIRDVNTGGGHIIVGNNNTIETSKPTTDSVDSQQLQELLSGLVEMLDQANKADGEALQQSMTELSNRLEQPLTPEEKPHLENEVKKANGLLKQLGESAKHIKELLPHLQMVGTWLGVTAAKFLFRDFRDL